MMRRLLPLLPLLLLVPALVLAQGDAPAEVAARAGRERACVADAEARLARLRSLFEAAERQLTRAPEGSPERRDAARTIEVLEGQIHEVGRDLLRCFPEKPAPTPERHVEVVTTGEGDSVVAESGRIRLDEGLILKKAERVDGRGKLVRGVVTRVFRQNARALARCHAELAERRAFESGDLTLAFTIDERGAARQVAVEDARLGDARFHACVRTLGERLVFPAPSGGSVRYSFELRFGDE